MKESLKEYLISGPEELRYKAPKTIYCKTKEEFDSKVGKDFIEHANQTTSKGDEFLVGLSHGESPSGPYEYILQNYSLLKHPEKIHYTFINSRLQRQRGLVDITDAREFVKELLRSNRITKDQILGRDVDRNDLATYMEGLNRFLKKKLKSLGKSGLDYVFVASTPTGQVAGITRNSSSFKTKGIVALVEDTIEPELTFTPSFLKKSNRVAFLATKAEKRRPLAWLFYRWGKINESPSFLRFIENVENRMVVFIDDHALTWPQVVINRRTDHGETNIRVDMAQPLYESEKTKFPVILMIHGFLGLNTFDALLAFIPTHKYIAAAMHYGSIPYDLPPKEYSQFVVENINAVVDFFGSKGYPVYIFDHSMANTYMLMINEQIDSLPGIKKYLKGRISSNPFFGQETKYAAEQFIDNVVLRSRISVADRIIFKTVKNIIPFQSKNGARNLGIWTSEWLIKADTKFNDRIWKAIKQRIMTLIGEMDTLPALNRIPLEHTLNRLPIKIFAIQIQSSLKESKKFDHISRLEGFEKHNIPSLILKSSNDPIAKFVSQVYDTGLNITILDITNENENDLFREHLFYMIHPRTTINILDHFIEETENQSSK